MDKETWVKVDYSDPRTLPKINEIVFVAQSYSWERFEDAAERTLGRWNGRYWEWIYYRPDFRHGTIHDLSIVCPGNAYITNWMPMPELPKEGETQ